MITNFTKLCDIVLANISSYHRELIVTLAALLFYIYLSSQNGSTILLDMCFRNKNLHPRRRKLPTEQLVGLPMKEM